MNIQHLEGTLQFMYSPVPITSLSTLSEYCAYCCANKSTLSLYECATIAPVTRDHFSRTDSGLSSIDLGLLGPPALCGLSPDLNPLPVGGPRVNGALHAYCSTVSLKCVTIAPFAWDPKPEDHIMEVVRAIRIAI